ncbi:MAG: hypothetical protein HYS12_04830 [Planctomycetes bacterium]|nr:hypothetical protein [Planctomycetota bacterium]
MWFPSLLLSLLLSRKPGAGRRPNARRHSAPHRRSFVPRLEALEDRTVPSTLTVLNNLDHGADSLRYAIGHARDGDTIVFAPSLAGQTITLTSGELDIKNSLDIEGPGASLLAISGNDNSRVFDISAGLTVTVADLTITHGRAAGNQGGGGILNVGSALNLVNDVFSNNRAIGSNADNSMGGGAITNRNGGVLTVIASTFYDNQVIGRDGGFGEGGALWNRASATITGSTFTGNRAVGGDGGRVTGGATIIGVANGGAIFNQSSGATLTVANTVFTGNEALGGYGGSGGAGASFYIVDGASGGAITNGDHASLVVSGCTFTSNRAMGGSNATGGASGQGRVGTASGGGVANVLGSVATVTSSIFDHNEAVGGSGNSGGSGAIEFSRGAGGAISNTLVATLTISGCTLTANQAIGGAGAIGGNGGNAFGGGVWNDDQCALTVTGSTITDNLATGGAAGEGGAVGLGQGGGLYLASGGTACLDAFTRDHAKHNYASTSDDDIFGAFSICS